MTIIVSSQAAALFITILYLAELRVPLLGRRNGRWRTFRVNIFGQYPVSWLNI